MIKECIRCIIINVAWPGVRVRCYPQRTVGKLVPRTKGGFLVHLNPLIIPEHAIIFCNVISIYFFIVDALVCF